MDRKFKIVYKNNEFFYADKPNMSALCQVNHFIRKYKGIEPIYVYLRKKSPIYVKNGKPLDEQWNKTWVLFETIKDQ